MNTSTLNVVVRPQQANVVVRGGESTKLVRDTTTNTIVRPAQTVTVARSQSTVVTRPGRTTLKVNFGPTGARGPKGDPGTSGGALITRTAAAAVNALRVLIATSNGEVIHADPTDTSHNGRVVGISTNSALSGETVNIQRFDTLDATGLSFTDGDAIYIGANGQLVNTAPVAATWWQIVGYAVSTTHIDIGLREPILLA